MTFSNEYRERALYWTECRVAEVPADDFWLTADEQLRLCTLRIPKRRADWRLGRWTAKSAVREQLQLDGHDLSPSQIEIRVRASGAPYASVLGRSINLSLSHSHGLAFCVVSGSTVPVGCDIEYVEPRSPAFVSDYLTADEQLGVAEQLDEWQKQTLVTLFWSAKESALKALELGLRADLGQLNVTGELAISPSESRNNLNTVWRRTDIKVSELRSLSGWWSQKAGFVRTVVCDPVQQLRRCSINLK